MSAGSTAVRQTVSNACAALRFCTTISTGPAGAGNRSDSANVRCDLPASGVLAHSANTDA